MKSANKRDEKRRPLKSDLFLWIYGAGMKPVILMAFLLFSGLFLLSGLLSTSPGFLLEPICAFLRKAFGNGAELIAILLIFFSFLIFAARFFLPKIRMSQQSKWISLLLILFDFFVVLTLVTANGNVPGGGDAGFRIFRFLSPSGNPQPLVIFLWVVLIASIYPMLQCGRWVPKMMRRIRKLIAENNQLSPLFQDISENQNENDEDIDKPAFSKRDFFKKGFNFEQTVVEGKKMDHPKERSNRLPPLNLLEPELGFYDVNENMDSFIEELESAMEEFDTPVRVIGCSVGPCVIQYQVKPGAISNESKGKASKNVRVNQVALIERDLAVRMGISTLTIQAPVPGENYIGIDIPNPHAMKVRLRPLLESSEFRNKNNELGVALGRDISGRPISIDLAEMPHLLVAGTTNSGKSICLRAMAVSLIMNKTPDQLRLIMIDPKRVELFRFNGLPHLLGKVETEYERSISVLRWAVQEMQNRLELFEKTAARNLYVYNRKAEDAGKKGLPRIVIIIDEMAEIMKGQDKEGEVAIDKLASLARAAGIHLVVATQRPDTTIINGKIKTNIPARIALNVASAMDSRVIMGKQGAEKLLGRGDMYFVDPTQNTPLRVQGALLTDDEIDRVVVLWKKLWPKPESEEEAPWEELIEENETEERSKDEAKLKQAISLVCRTRKASAANISARLKISQPTASRLIDRMEEIGVVGPMRVGGKAREVLWDEDEADSYGEDAGYSKEE